MPASITVSYLEVQKEMESFSFRNLKREWRRGERNALARQKAKKVVRKVEKQTK